VSGLTSRDLRLQALIETLHRDSASIDSWCALGVLVRGGLGAASLGPLQPLRGRLRRLLRSSPDHPGLSLAMLGLLNLEAQPNLPEGPPSWWRRPGRLQEGPEGSSRDPATHLPLRALLTSQKIEMLLIPGGSSWTGKATQGKRVRLRGFYLSRYPIARGQAGLSGNPDLPLVSWTHSQAQSWCRSLGGRLPAELEWERAGRGEAARRFPWGDRPPAGNLVPGGFQARQRGTSFPEVHLPVGGFPPAASPFGVEEMVGHVAEFCLERWHDRVAVRGGNQILRSYGEQHLWTCNLLTRRAIPCEARHPRLGFRLCLPLLRGHPPRPPSPPRCQVDDPEKLHKEAPNSQALTMESCESP
jgi:formylglycine-generating enzyme required for sulfatase activity